MKNLRKSFDTNTHRLSCLILCFFTGIAQAALPPDFQNEKDLADIVSYIKSDHEVLSNLRVIDLEELAVYYGESCRIQFARKVVKRDADWVGPAEPVEFKARDCLDGTEDEVKENLPEGKVLQGVIVSAETNDVACYLQIKDEAGTVHDELASFDLCEDETLLNKPSEFIYQQTSIMAASCDGDPDCTDSEQIWLIAEVK